MTGVALDLKGHTAKAHIDKWQQYGEKSQQHATSAAILLLEAKAELGHGAFTSWLSTYEIAPSTARRLMLEYRDPDKREARQSESRGRSQEWRKKQATLRTAHTYERFGPPTGDEPYAPTVTTSETNLTVEEQREFLHTLIQEASDVKIEWLYDRLRNV